MINTSYHFNKYISMQRLVIKHSLMYLFNITRLISYCFHKLYYRYPDSYLMIFCIHGMYIITHAL